MRLYSWNINGYRAALKKGFNDWLQSVDADVVNLQEIKVQPDQLTPEQFPPEPWQAIWNPSKVKKGYSGVASFSKTAPLSHSFGLPQESHQGEGRLIHMEFEAFHFFNVYFPNGQKDDERLQYKLGYYDAFLEHAESLRKDKPIVVCGDFNTAHKEIDLARPKANEKTSGFLPIERAWLDKFVEHGYVDTFRMFEPGPDRYTWWSFRANARANNVGWRIDYFFVSDELKDKVTAAWIDDAVMGSDHCPLGVEIAV